MSRAGRLSRTEVLVWTFVFATLALVVPPLGAWSLLLHEHGLSGYHLHGLPESTSDQPGAGRLAWHEHQHDHGRSSGPHDDPLEQDAGSVPPGLVLHASGPWSLVTFPAGRQLIELAAAFRALSPCEQLVNVACDAAILPRSEWPPPGGSSSGVRWLLQTSHALLI